MRMMAERMCGLRQAKRLAKRTARKRKLAAERKHANGETLSTGRAKRRADYLEQVRADQAAGLEWRRVSVPAYRELCRRKG
jgi:hypothetical protein